MDEGTRGGNKNGVSYKMISLTKPKNMGYAKAKDQIHRIVANINRRVFVASNTITLGFEFISGKSTGKSNRLWDESAGFDNIRVKAVLCKTMKLPRPTAPPRRRSIRRKPDRSKIGKFMTTPPRPTPKFWFVGKEDEVDFETALEQLLSRRVTEEVRAEFGGKHDCLYLQDPTVWINLIEKEKKPEAIC
mmetsp:Transcript_12266/g.17637  ORF Transcript_12266/g.17637 Transcript_12266/m.17637 type:complete len:189 (-) Transcript_12266:50-616(-)